MSEIEVFLDETPGETQGIVVRDGRAELLILHREGDAPEHRLGARLIGRVARTDGAFRAAFVDLGVEGPQGFLPLGKAATVAEGQAVEVEVVAEPRDSKGPALRLIAGGQGAPRLLAAGPTVAERLAAVAPGVQPVTGVAAIQAGWDAEEEALATGAFFPEAAIDLAVERTRALIAVDIDHAPPPGRDARKARERANCEGLRQSARLIRLKGWGGLVVVDLVGTTLDPAAVTAMAKAAFAGDPEVAFGPLSRFGLLQLSVPWRTRPVEEILNDGSGRRAPRTRAIDVVRHLRHALLSDTRIARLTARCAPADAEAAASLVARLGPRAGVLADPATPAGRFVIEEG